MPVPLTPPYLQFFDANGAPLANGTVDTYAATTSTKKATYTDVGGATTAPNPIQLNASGIPETGNGMIFINGAYRIVVKDQFGAVIDDQPSITSFTNTTATVSPFFQSFSGTGSQTAFTLSSSLGTDSKRPDDICGGAESWVLSEFSGTGSQTVFTLSTAKGTDSSSLIVMVYNAAAADPLGFEPVLPTAYTINGTTLTFSVAPVTGTDNIYVMQPTQQSTTGIAGYISPTLYTVNGTALTFTTAPVSGTNNIMVTAPSTLAGAAAASAAAADASATAAGNSATAAAGSASSAAAFAAAKNKWTYSSTTTMADPSTGNLRLNNATLASVTAIAISNLSADSGNPDLSGWTSTWDDAGGSNRGSVYLYKDNANFAIYNINSANVDNSGWKQLAVTYVTKAGSFSNSDTLYIGFAASGTTTVTGGITALTGDVTASGSGSVAATISGLALSKLATQAGNTILAEATGSTAVPTAVTVNTNSAIGRLAGNITNIGIGTSANNLVQLNGSAQLPAVDGSLLTGISSIPLGTPVAVSGTTAVITVDFTTYCSYKLYYFAASSGGSVTYTVEFSQNAGSSYLTTSYTLTGAATNLGAASTNDYVGGTLDIFQPATSGEIYAVVNFAAEDLSGNRNGVVDAPSTAAVNRVRISVTGSVNGFYTLVPQARR